MYIPNPHFRPQNQRRPAKQTTPPPQDARPTKPIATTTKTLQRPPPAHTPSIVPAPERMQPKQRSKQHVQQEQPQQPLNQQQQPQVHHHPQQQPLQEQQQNTPQSHQQQQQYVPVQTSKSPLHSYPVPSTSQQYVPSVVPGVSDQVSYTTQPNPTYDQSVASQPIYYQMPNVTYESQNSSNLVNTVANHSTVPTTVQQWSLPPSNPIQPTYVAHPSYSTGNFHDMSIPLQPAVPPPPNIPQSLHSTALAVQEANRVILNPDAPQYNSEFPPIANRQ